MAKNQEIEFDTTAANNTDAGGVSIAEGWAAADVNNSIRYLMKARADAISRHVAKAAGSYTAAKTDHNQFWRCTGAVTVNLTAAATLTSGWCLWVRANGGAVTIDPNGAETIDGVATKTFADGMTGLIMCTGTAFFTVVSGRGGGDIVAGPSSATDNAIARFDGTTGNVIQNSAVTVADTTGEFGLPSGHITNYNSGNYTVTHSAGLLTYSGAMTVSGAFTSLGIDDNATGERLQITDTQFDTGSSTAASNYRIGRPIDTGSLQINGGDHTGGGDIRLFGGDHASQASDIEFQGSGGLVYQWDNSATTHYFSDNSRFSQSTTDSPGNGNNTTGAGLNDVNNSFSGSGAVVCNRTADGNVILINSGGTNQGIISIAGATTTYAAFNGSHPGQFPEEQRKRLLRGTVLEAIDELSDWKENPYEVLPKVKISDTAESKNVYGVFFDFYDANPDDDTLMSSALGAYSIRVDPAETVAMGDLLVSAGNGCAKVQDDDILRSKTIAKVTGTTKLVVYDDGSYLVPCTLHCG